MANQNDYTIPFGIDSKKFFDGLNEIDGGVDTLAENVVNANKDMQKGFDASAQSSDKLNKVLSTSVEKSTALNASAKDLGSTLGSALSGKNVPPDLEKKLTTFTDLMNKFSTTANKKVSFNIDTAKLQQFQKILDNGVTSMKDLDMVIDFTKQKLAELDPNSQEFADLNTQLETAQTFLKAFNDASEGTETRTKSLKQQLKDMKVALAEMEIAGKGDTAQFKALSIQAGQLEDQIGDVSKRVRVLASDSKFIDAGVQAVTGLVGAFTAAQGAVALFGNENEDLTKALQKVTGAMAVLQGIQAVANALNKDSALSVILFGRGQQAAAVATEGLAAAELEEAAATEVATTATKSWTVALLANPIFLLVAVVAAVTVALLAFTGGQSDAEKATQDLNDALERQSDLLKADETDLKRRTDINVARAKAAGDSESKITQIQGKALLERLKLQKDNDKELTDLYNDEFNKKNRSAEDDKKLEEAILKNREDIQDTLTDIQVKKFDLDKQRSDESKALAKKNLEDQKKNAEEEQKILEQQINFAKQLGDARVSAIKDEYDRERATIRQGTIDRIAELQKEIILSAEAGIKRVQLITQLRKNEADAIAKVDKKEAEDKFKLQFQADSIIADLLNESANKQIELTRLKYLEKKHTIEEQYKDDADTRKRLIKALSEAEADELDKAAKKREIDDLDRAEEIEKLQVETAVSLMGNEPKIEEQKQISILQVQVKYAKKKLQALLDQGNDENSLVVLQAKKTVQDLEKALGVAIADQKGKSKFSIFDILGLGSLTDGQKAAVEHAAQQSLKSITEITGFIIDQYQRQIDKKQEVIDQIDQSINDLESQLDKEKQLKEDGFANNVDLLQKELDAKKKAKDDELKQQEEIQRKQRAAQKAQLILDTAIQAGNLITSATEIFRSLAPIPFVGIPLAIATIALMTGAFVTAKVKAFQLVNDGGAKGFGEGGYIDGEPHSRGGQKYVSVDGEGGVVELEGGEHVTNKKSTRKYSQLLDAINEDRLSGMSDEGLRDLLSGMGIHFNSNEGNEALEISRSRDEYKEKVMILQPGNDIGELIEITKDVKYLADKKRNEVERWEDEGFYYTKSGQRTERTAKKKT